jgi:hypothetical protein
LLAELRLENTEETHRVRVRNLSDGGMMGEGSLRVQRGMRLEVDLRNIGAVRATVAWVQDNRFGVAFDAEIDSQRARLPADGRESELDALTSYVHRAPKGPDPKSFRKL